MITQLTSWQVVEDGRIVDKPHLAILVDNRELDTLLAYLEAIGTDHSLEMRSKLLRFQGKIPAVNPFGRHSEAS